MDTINTMLMDYTGNTLMQITWFLVSIAGGVIMGKIFYYISRFRLKKMAQKSKTKFDDYLIDIIEEPVVLLLFTVGMWVGAKFLTLNETGVAFFGKIMFVLIAITITWFILRFIDMLITEYLDPLVSQSESKLDDQILPIVRKSAKGIILILAIVVILSNLGYDILSVLAGLGVGGLALALAAQDAVKNVIGGFSIFWDKPFQIDDFVEISGESGTVAEVGVRSTRLRTAGGTTVVIPNSKVADQVIENFSTRQRRRVTVNIGLTYDTSAKRMDDGMQIIHDTIKAVEGTDGDDTMVRFTNFGAYSLDLEVVYWIVDMSNWKMIIHEVNMGIKRNLDEAKIDMAFPTETHYVVQQQDA